jgi:hypothetical protein
LWTALWVALCLLSPGWASAQGLLESYRRATTALTRSADVFATDQVESLDALRRAEEAAAPLLAGLEPSLRTGLTTTFARAEAAIVNRSETDLRVQAAVLRGGGAAGALRSGAWVRRRRRPAARPGAPERRGGGPGFCANSPLEARAGGRWKRPSNGGSPPSAWRN